VPAHGWPERRGATVPERFWLLRNQQNRSIFLFLLHFRTRNRFTLLLEML
jgi:hypothetical protein